MTLEAQILGVHLPKAGRASSFGFNFPTFCQADHPPSTSTKTKKCHAEPLGAIADSCRAYSRCMLVFLVRSSPRKSIR